MHTIAIDCGASFVKYALFDSDGITLREGSKASPRTSRDLQIGDAPQMAALMKNVREIIRKLSYGLECAKLCISNEMHGFVLTNEDGEPILDYVSWQNEYGSIKNNGHSPVEILSEKNEILTTGMPVRAGLPSSNLLYLTKEKMIKGNKIRFYTLGDYIIRSLSGKEPNIHPTNAAATGLYNLIEQKWDKNLISLVVGDYDITFPEVGFEIVECKVGDLKIYIPPAIGDQQATLLGAGLTEMTDLSFNLGTGAQVSSLTDKIELSKDRKYQIRPFFNGKYLKTIPHIPSGRALNVYINFIKDILKKTGIDIDTNDIWEKVLSVKSKKEKLSMDLSFFENPITCNTTASIGNITESNLTFDNLFDSIFEAMADNFISQSRIIQPDKIDRIIFSGGISKRIPQIRKRIISHYGATDSLITDDGALSGLRIYSQM